MDHGVPGRLNHWKGGRERRRARTSDSLSQALCVLSGDNLDPSPYLLSSVDLPLQNFREHPQRQRNELEL